MEKGIFNSSWVNIPKEKYNVLQGNTYIRTGNVVQIVDHGQKNLFKNFSFLSWIADEKIKKYLKPYGHTDIWNYKVALLLKIWVAGKFEVRLLELSVLSVYAVIAHIMFTYYKFLGIILFFNSTANINFTHICSSVARIVSFNF